MANSSSTITLPVRNLEVSKEFYLAALKPIGYHIVSYTHHKLVDGTSDAYSFGPVNTRRVDLIISESSKSALNTRAAGRPRIRFVSMTTVGVEQFYDAARATGGVSVLRPCKRSLAYTAAVYDPDGYHVEVTFEDSKVIPTPAPKEEEPPVSSKSSSIQRWREQVADEKTPGGVITCDSSEAVPVVSASRSIASTQMSTSKPSASPQEAPASNTNSGISTKQVLGAMAVASLVIGGTKYIVEEVNDSKVREAEFREKLSLREDLEDEALAASRKADRVATTPAKSSHRKKSGANDSGYYSLGVRSNKDSGARQHGSTSHGRTSSSSSRRTAANEQPRVSHRSSGTTASTKGALRAAGAPATHITVSQPPSKPLPPSYQPVGTRIPKDAVHPRQIEYSASGTRAKEAIPYRGPTSRSGTAKSRTSGRTVRYAHSSSSKRSTMKIEGPLDSATVLPDDSISQTS